jgi:hypothetical protein
MTEQPRDPEAILARYADGPAQLKAGSPYLNPCTSGKGGRADEPGITWQTMGGHV